MVNTVKLIKIDQTNLRSSGNDASKKFNLSVAAMAAAGGTILGMAVSSGPPWKILKIDGGDRKPIKVELYRSWKRQFPEYNVKVAEACPIIRECSARLSPLQAVFHESPLPSSKYLALKERVSSEIRAVLETFKPELRRYLKLDVQISDVTRNWAPELRASAKQAEKSAEIARKIAHGESWLERVVKFFPRLGGKAFKWIGRIAAPLGMAYLSYKALNKIAEAQAEDNAYFGHNTRRAVADGLVDVFSPDPTGYVDDLVKGLARGGIKEIEQSGYLTS